MSNENIKKIRLYTDGGARGNPGPAAAGAVLKTVGDDGEEELVASVSQYLGETTNNQAEYMALILGLEKAREIGVREVEVRMDSELAIKQINGEYKVKNPDIAKRFLEVHNLKQQFSHITFRHVRREFNKEADALVNEAIDAHLQGETVE